MSNVCSSVYHSPSKNKYSINVLGLVGWVFWGSKKNSTKSWPFLRKFIVKGHNIAYQLGSWILDPHHLGLKAGSSSS